MFKRKRSYARKPTRKRTYVKKRTTPIRRVYRRINTISRKLAAEVFKFESTPDMYKNLAITSDDSEITATVNQPLLQITSGEPWIMPLNWIYQGESSNGQSVYVNGKQYTATNYSGPPVAAVKNPIYRNTEEGIEEFRDSGVQLQYRLKYIYINALFNASINDESMNNSDGAKLS